jgi:hypothetical protein
MDNQVALHGAHGSDFVRRLDLDPGRCDRPFQQWIPYRGEPADHSGPECLEGRADRQARCPQAEQHKGDQIVDDLVGRNGTPLDAALDPAACGIPTLPAHIPAPILGQGLAGWSCGRVACRRRRATRWAGSVLAMRLPMRRCSGTGGAVAAPDAWPTSPPSPAWRLRCRAAGLSPAVV